MRVRVRGLRFSAQNQMGIEMDNESDTVPKVL